MASKARKAFDENRADIDRLLEIHKDVGGNGPGRKWGVEVLNKSAIVLITAVWEAYCEDLVAEGLRHLVNHGTPDNLPKDLRKQIAKELKGDKNELAVWALCQDGWKKVLSGRLAAIEQQRNFDWNTPKASRVAKLFEDALGFPSVTTAWTWPGMTSKKAADKLDKYVSLRGDIAHRGTGKKPVQKSQVDDYLAHVKQLVSKTGGRVSSDLKKATGKALFKAKKTGPTTKKKGT